MKVLMIEKIKRINIFIERADYEWLCLSIFVFILSLWL